MTLLFTSIHSIAVIRILNGVVRRVCDTFVYIYSLNCCSSNSSFNLLHPCHGSMFGVTYVVLCTLHISLLFVLVVPNILRDRKQSMILLQQDIFSWKNVNTFRRQHRRCCSSTSPTIPPTFRQICTNISAISWSSSPPSTSSLHLTGRCHYNRLLLSTLLLRWNNGFLRSTKRSISNCLFYRLAKLFHCCLISPFHACELYAYAKGNANYAFDKQIGR